MIKRMERHLASALVATVGRGIVAAVMLGLAISVSAFAADGPVPPCGGAPRPAFADPGMPPAVQSWTTLSEGDAWAPPACTGWKEPNFRVIVALAGSFRFDGAADDLLSRFGAVSGLRDIRYWSVTRQSWETLVTDAAALKGLRGERREDFSAPEMMVGRDLFVIVDDGRTSSGTEYRLRVLERSQDRVVIAMENATAIRAYFLTVFEPGELQSVFFLEKRSPGTWGLYALSRTGGSSTWLAGRHEASFVNRSVAFYRHFVGIPTDQEPPASR